MVHGEPDSNEPAGARWSCARYFSRAGEQDAAGDIGERGQGLREQREAEVRRIERDRGLDVVDQWATVKEMTDGEPGQSRSVTMSASVGTSTPTRAE